MRIYLFTLLTFLSTTFAFAQSYTNYLTGSDQDMDVQPDFGICLMGGAGESDEGMTWFLEKANGGDVVVIRTSGSDGYNNYMYSQLGVTLNSVETIVFHSAAAANDPYVIGRLTGAEAIWIAGGDQSVYVNYWRGTPVEDAVNELINVKGGAIGGLSAGMAVMAQGYFSAQNGSITSEAALANPFDISVTLGWNDFIHAPYLENAVTETHFNDPSRIRYGRIMAFMARLSHDQDLPFVRGVAANEYCAIAIDEDGIARAFGEYPQYSDEYVYFLQSNCEVPQTPEIIEPGQPLTWNRNYKAVKVYKVPATTGGDNYFDLTDWLSGQGGAWENWYVVEGELTRSDDELPPDCIVGVPDREEKLFEIYPNPTSDILELHFLKPFSGNWHVLDGLGRTVMSGQISTDESNSIDVSKLKSGTYKILVVSEYSTNSSSFIKTR